MKVPPSLYLIKKITFPPVPKSLWLATALVFLGSAAQSHAQVLSNGGFESVTITQPTNNTYTTTFGTLSTATFTNWTLGTSTGNSYDGILVAGGTNFFTPVPATHAGTNAIFLQGTGSVTHSAVSLLPGLYTLSFYELARTGNGSGQPLTDTITGATAGSILNATSTPTNTGATAADYQLVTQNFTVVVPDSYTLSFAGTIPFGTSDHTDFLDDVAIVAVVPEPGTVSCFVLGAGLVALTAFYRRKSRRA